MKKLLILLLLLILPVVNAEIQVFDSNRDVYNLNSLYDLEVSITDNVEGFLKSIMICGNYSLDYFIIPVDISSKQSFDIPNLKMNSLMLGSCYVKISLFDTNWELIEEKNGGDFEVSDELIINANLNKNNYLPGDKLRVYGDVKDMVGDVVQDINFDIFLDGVVIESFESSDEEFDYKFNLDEDIKTGEHIVKLYIYDEYENKGVKELNFNVEGVASELKNWLNKLDFLPGDIVEIKGLLYDQGGDLFEEDVEIRVIKDGLEVLYKNVKVDEVVKLILDDKAKPGEWEIETKSVDFNIISYFNVLEFVDIGAYLDNGLFIENLGNVAFDGDVVIYLDDYSFTKNVDLEVGGVEEIELFDVDDGSYNLKVQVNGKEFDLGEINIEDDRGMFEKVGNVISGNLIVTNVSDFFSNQTVYAVLVILVIVVGLYFYFKDKKKKSFEKKREKDIIEGQLKMKKIKENREGVKKKPKRKLFFGANKVDRKDAEDFKEQMLKDGKSKNLFGMFD
ncbi:MAG: hypothetical protein KJ674_00190 [Nanoarchaeota archaeon]|nr:hypothetical protein [Nanoarchaeota archaeon]